MVGKIDARLRDGDVLGRRFPRRDIRNFGSQRDEFYIPNTTNKIGYNRISIHREISILLANDL
jgi:hypothetical protein